MYGVLGWLGGQSFQRCHRTALWTITISSTFGRSVYFLKKRHGAAHLLHLREDRATGCGTLSLHLPFPPSFARSIVSILWSQSIRRFIITRPCSFPFKSKSCIILCTGHPRGTLYINIRLKGVGQSHQLAPIPEDLHAPPRLIPSCEKYV